MEDHMETGLLAVGLLVLAAGLFMWQEAERRRDRAKRKAKRKEEFGEDPRTLPRAAKSRELLDEIAIYYEETKEELAKTAVDEVTWNDLEMDEVFLRINHTQSYIGEQVLYRRLHETGERDWETWEEQLSYFTEHETEREEVQEALWRIGKEREAYYLPMFLKNAKVLAVGHLWVYRMLQLFLFGGAAAAILSGNPAFLLLSGVTALINVSVYALSKEKYEAYLYALGSVRELLLFHRLLSKREDWRKLFVTEEMEEAGRQLGNLLKSIGRYQGKKMASWSGDAFAIFRDYIIGATLWDITAFGHIAKQLSGKMDSLFLLYEAAGCIDTEIAVASFRKSLVFCCIPEGLQAASMSESAKHDKKRNGLLRAEKLYHPLLNAPIYNDFAPEGGCLITGANATGKSTFSKAVAVNAILAQTIHTCAAAVFSMPYMQVITSMAVRDDLVEGQSYYIREISYLKRIVDAVGGGLPVLCVIDEILRGTNTAERLAASEVICRYLAGKNCLAIVATHDIELTRRLAAEYRCYHFKSEIQGEEMVFDYKIHEGVGNNRNAIKLLALMKFPEEIVSKAQTAVIDDVV